jgi:hypothetical protein
MTYELIGYDANGTDGTDDSAMTAIYQTGAGIVRVPKANMGAWEAEQASNTTIEERLAQMQEIIKLQSDVIMEMLNVQN